MRKCLIQNQAELGEGVTPVLSYFLKITTRNTTVYWALPMSQAL